MVLLVKLGFYVWVQIYFPSLELSHCLDSQFWGLMEYLLSLVVAAVAVL